MSAVIVDHGQTAPVAEVPGAADTPLDDLTAELFDLDVRAVPVPDMTGSNTTTECTDNGCSSTCPSVGCTPGCT